MIQLLQSRIEVSPQLRKIQDQLQPINLDASYNQIGVKPLISSLRRQYKERFRCIDRSNIIFLQNHAKIGSNHEKMQLDQDNLDSQKFYYPISPSRQQIQPNVNILELDTTQTQQNLSYNRPLFTNRKLQRKKHGLTIFTETRKNIISTQPEIRQNKTAMTPNKIDNLKKLSQTANSYYRPQPDFYSLPHSKNETFKVKYLLQIKPSTKEELSKTQRLFKQQNQEKPKQTDLEVLNRGKTAAVVVTRELFKVNKNYTHQIVNYEKHQNSLPNRSIPTQPRTKKQQRFQLNDIWNDNFLDYNEQ